MSLQDDLLQLKQLYIAANRTVSSLRKEGSVVFPPENEVLNCFAKLQLEDIKVVILGQDPYHGKGQAHGYSFSVKKGVPKPPSLKNIFKELEDDLGLEEPDHGNLQAWEKEGVLLLNKILTVEEGKPKSHRDLGWDEFTTKFIQIINNYRENVVFILWGSEAQKVEKFIDINKHMVLKSAHPSPLSASRGFFGCKHFSKTNEYLDAVGKKQINWKVE